jgi:hypothetical protein
MPKQNKAWKDAIVEVLAATGKAMHYTEIADEIVAKKLRNDVGATPASTVNVIIHESIKKDSEDSPFVKVGRGEFVLRSNAAQITAQIAQGAETATADEKEETGGIIKAFGMYWLLEKVSWSIKPSILGQQQEGASTVNFADQVGVYLLYDGREVVYVGRTAEKRLATRLSEHTRDRLNGRWDRFSWFGLRSVTSSGQLGDYELDSVAVEDVIVTIEALLIEGLEPRQNRKRGDAFRAVEYLQVQDPEIVKKNKKKLAAEILSSIDNSSLA